MSVQRFTAQDIFAFGYLPRSREFIANVGTGTVTVEVWDGADWVLTDTVTADAAKDLRTAGVRLRITPTGDATFSLDMNDGGL